MSGEFDLILLSHVMEGSRPFGAQGYFFRELGALADGQGLTLGVADVFSGPTVNASTIYDVQGVSLGQNHAAPVYYDRLTLDRPHPRPTLDRAALEKDADVFNRLSVLEIAGDKLTTYRCLMQSHLPVPRTASVAQILSDPDELAQFSPALVLKPRHGSRGSGILFVRRTADGLVHKDGTIDTDSLQRDFAGYLVQDDVGWREVLEVRTLVQRRQHELEAIGSYAKVPQAADGLGNITHGAHARSLEEVPEFPARVPIDLIERNALAAAVAIERCAGETVFEVGVDQAVSRDGVCWILEVNGRPARFGFELVARNASEPSERAKYADIRKASVQNVLSYAQGLGTRT